MISEVLTWLGGFYLSLTLIAAAAVVSASTMRWLAPKEPGVPDELIDRLAEQGAEILDGERGDYRGGS